MSTSRPARRRRASIWLTLATAVAALPLTASARPPNKPTVGMEWELHGPAEVRSGPHFLVIGGMSSKGERVAPTRGGFERVMCTTRKDGSYPLVSITIDNQIADSQDPKGSTNTSGWDRGTLEIVTGPLPYDDVENRQKILTFLTAFFDAVAASCKAHPTPSSYPDDQNACAAPVADVVARMNQLPAIKGAPELVALDNQVKPHPCGGPEFDLRRYDPSVGRKLTAQQVMDEAIGKREQFDGRPVFLTKTTATLDGMVGQVGTQASFSIGLDQIGAGYLTPLFGPEKSTKPVAKPTYERAVRPDSDSAPSLAQFLDLRKIGHARTQVGFWALALYGASADTLGWSGTARKDAHNLLLRTPLNAVFAAVYPEGLALTKELATALDKTFCDGACSALARTFDAVNDQSDPTSQHKPLASRAGEVVIEARLGGWVDALNLVVRDGKLAIADEAKAKATLAMLAPIPGAVEKIAIGDMVTIVVRVSPDDAVAIKRLDSNGRRARGMIDALSAQDFAVTAIDAEQGLVTGVYDGANLGAFADVKAGAAVSLWEQFD